MGYSVEKMRKSPRTASSRSCLRRATRSRRKLKPARNTITGWLPAQKRRTRPKTRKSRSNSSSSSSTRNCKSTTYQLSKKKRLSRARSRPKTLLANRWTRNRKRPSRHVARPRHLSACNRPPAHTHTHTHIHIHALARRHTYTHTGAQAHICPHTHAHGTDSPTHRLFHMSWHARDKNQPFSY